MSRRLEIEVRARYPVSDDFVSYVLRGDDPRVPRKSIDEERHARLFLEAPPQTPPSTALVQRWRRIRRAIARPGIASPTADAAAHDAGAEDVDRAMLAVRALGGALGDAELDGTIEALDRGITSLLDAILHDPALQALEASWRSVAYLVDFVDLERNVELHLLNADAHALANDLDRPPEASGLHAHLYTGAYAEGRPYALAGALVELGLEHVELLERIGTVCGMAQVVCIAGAARTIFGPPEARRIGRIDLRLASPELAPFRALRERSVSRYLCLCAQRHRTRFPYECAVEGTYYREEFDDHDVGPPWASSVVLLVQQLADAFVRRGMPVLRGNRRSGHAPSDWIPNIPRRRASPVGVQEPTRPAYLWNDPEVGYGVASELWRERFTAWSESYGLPYFEVTPPSLHVRAPLDLVLFATRFAHYLAVARREVWGTIEDCAELERELAWWLATFVTDDEEARMPFKGSPKTKRKKDHRTAGAPCAARHCDCATRARSISSSSSSSARCAITSATTIRYASRAAWIGCQGAQVGSDSPPSRRAMGVRAKGISNSSCTD